MGYPRRELELEHYKRIIESTARQISMKYSVLIAEETLRETGKIMRAEAIKDGEARR